MQTVIAEYTTSSAVDSALRQLEAHGLSLEDVLIVDLHRHAWRTPQLAPAQEVRANAGFLMLMMDGHENAEQARRILRAAARS